MTPGNTNGLWKTLLVNAAEAPVGSCETEFQMETKFSWIQLQSHEWW